MTIQTRPLKAAALLAATALLPTFAAPAVRAADPYDATLEKRVEALERELNLMSGDSKGKNTQTYEVPTFMRAAGKQVQELTIQGELRFRTQWDTRETNVTPGLGNQIQQVRERMRLRLNLNYKFSDNWFAGLGITTYAGSDGNHQTIGEGFDNQSIYLTSTTWAGRLTTTSPSSRVRSWLRSTTTRTRSLTTATSGPRV